MKILDVSTGFTQWDGVTPLDFSDEDKRQYILADAITALANASHLMGLTNLEKMSLYTVARAAAKKDAKEIGVEEADFAALKKAAEPNEVDVPQRGKGPIFLPIVHGQLMQLLNKAPDKKE